MNITNTLLHLSMISLALLERIFFGLKVRFSLCLKSILL